MAIDPPPTHADIVREVSLGDLCRRQWDEYVGNHPKGSIFHTSSMLQACEVTQAIDPFARAAINAEGQIVALLASYRVQTIERLAAVSSRAIQFAEPLCDSTEQGVQALASLVSGHDRYMHGKALMCEVRSIQQPGPENRALLVNGYEFFDYVNYVVDVRSDPDTLWMNLNKRVRQKIRSSHRKGLVIRDDESPEGVHRLYQLLQSSYRLARVPLPSQSLFLNSLRYLPQESLRIRTAFHAGLPVASIISLVFGGRVFSWFGGTRRIPGISAFACIVWDDIRWAHERGHQYYDFGGAGRPEEDYGPRRFKAQFGGEEVRYGRYAVTYSRVKLRLAEIGYELSRKMGVWS